MERRDYKTMDFAEKFAEAKENAVYSNAMDWLKEIINNDSMSEKERFRLIERIVLDAQKHLEN